MKTLTHLSIGLILASAPASLLLAQSDVTAFGGFENVEPQTPTPRIAEIRLEPKQISLAVEEFADAFVESGDGSEAYLMPTIIWDKDSLVQMVQAPLRLVNVGPADGLALIAASAGCVLEPINSPPQNDEARPRIIGYRINKIESSQKTNRIFVGREPGIAKPASKPLFTPTVAIQPPAITFTDESDVLMIDPSGDPIEEPPALVGIGVTLREEEGEIVIGNILPDSPASKFDVIKPGTRIKSVGPNPEKPIDLDGLRMHEVVGLIRGKEETPVTLWVRDAQSNKDDLIEVTLEREKLSAPQTIPAPAPPVAPRVTVVNPVAPRATNSTISQPRFLMMDAAKPAAAPQTVRVYAAGAILWGDEEQIMETIAKLEKMIAVALDLAELPGEGPDFSVHEDSRTIIAKGTDDHHDIISQVILAWKENAESDKIRLLNSRPPAPR